MRWVKRLFSTGRSAGGGRLHPSERDDGECRRWAAEILLSISGDAPESSRKALAAHLSACSSCRAEEARARALREACLRVGAIRGPAPDTGLWEELAANLGARSDVGAAVPPVAWPPRPVVLRRRTIAAAAIAVASVAAAILGLAWLGGPAVLDRPPASDPSPQAAIQERWNRDWNEFVSGTEPGRGIQIDPFAPEIANPDEIDF